MTNQTELFLECCELRNEVERLKALNAKQSAVISDLEVANYNLEKGCTSLADEAHKYKTALEKIADRNAHGVMVTIAREALNGDAK